MKIFNIIHAFVTLFLMGILVACIFDKNPETPIVTPIELPQGNVDIKIAAAVDSVLKAVSKTDGQLIDFYLDQQSQLDDANSKINTLENQLKRIPNF